ncbi:cilia- and flagella-associated protein 65-like isoform X1 [Maniola jurtina]|uniref:cilia- and flagella-associated protein 65-like isoform X1 n=1 Tax=Maniola jurtina TaxID=191418 RepID=UPI001E689F55|nr:cilia- and flagella-associated protein 65-like isoform X1 [Maniola jurtina]XP_045785827.1 cilia- and flagella-associated protein 65-like isoform X1 [Maniola jurtina]XP_045785828.1 cilia- and flagella-associated protein 65-like isoform X1 [Maniola jurtina]
MQNFSVESISENKIVSFDCIPVDTVAEKRISIQNVSEGNLTYRVSLIYVLNSIDHVFKLSITSTPVKSLDWAEVKIIFRPNVAGQSYTEYYMVDDTAGNVYRLTVTGKCFGPHVTLNKKKLVFRICKNVSEKRKEVINMINKSGVDATYQWLLPTGGQGFFQISKGNCGVIRAFENITTTITFSGIALGVYTAELVCLVLNQEPLYLNVIASVVLAGNPMYNIQDHVFEKNWKVKSRSAHLMENSLTCLSNIPSASVFERYLDFGTGSVSDVTMNISQTLCVTNHEKDDGCIQWIPDADNVFIIDPIACVIPPNESRLFTIRFRPKVDNEVYGYLLCGDYQYKKYDKENDEFVQKIKHTWFRIPCVGNTWPPCSVWKTEWDCPTEVVLPPTVPARTTFTNFMLSNKLDTPMHFKLQAPYNTNFVVMPMCGIVPGRGWQIITVALEPKVFGEYIENWDLIINKAQKVRITFCGNAEISQVEMMSHGYNPGAHAMYEFQPTITGCTNYCTAYMHNLTRMETHMRVISHVTWLGADDNGVIILPPKEIVKFHWWFFPREADKVYETTVTCSCICLIDGKPVGEPTEVFINIIGFSELPNLKVLPIKLNIHDTAVGESVTFPVTLYNYGSCFFTSKLYHLINGMGDDFSGDKFDIDSSVNSLKPSDHCEVNMTVTAEGAGSRQIDIKYTVLFRTEYDVVEEIQPIKKTICIIWYDGIYPTIKVKRTITVNCPIILSNHCVWNMINVEEFNKALEECRPNKPLNVNLYTPDLCVRHSDVELILILGCIYALPVPFNFRREKICDCEMVEVQTGISTYEMRHNCIHRPLVELVPMNGIVTPENPVLLHLKLKYTFEGRTTLCFVMTMPNHRTLNVFINIYAHENSKGVLVPLRRLVGVDEYLTVMDCGRVPINNLDPVIRITWLYNPTDVFTTWRLLRGNNITPDTVIKCLQYFAEVPPNDKLAIPFAFMPTEMIDYEVVFYCSFGYDIVKILVKGQGGLPNCIETRLDIPLYVERIIRAAYRHNVVSLSKEHMTLPIMLTHSLSRDIIAISNDTDHVIRFIWLPERIPNLINIVMTPWWGVIQPKSTEWITMTVYTLQEPATFTTTVTCELLDLTERRRYQKNEVLRRAKTEKCNQEFIITEDGLFHPDINDCPPYVLDIKKPLPSYLAMTVAISTRGQRDGYNRMLLKQMWEQTPPYDLLSSDVYGNLEGTSGNNMTTMDVSQIIDALLWEALHSKMFKFHLEYYAKEDIPTHDQLVKAIESDMKSKLSKRVTSGICDAIVNKAMFSVYNLNCRHEFTILEAE